MGRMCDGICNDCYCGADKIKTPTKTKEEKHLYNMEKAYRTLKHIADGGGYDPRIYAQNTIDAISRN